LVDDDFLSIARAVRLGRRIYENIRKGMRYVVSIHVPIGGLALVPVLLGWPLVLLPLHIVFLELIIDPACSIAFEAEPEEPGLMDRPPRPSGEPILDGRTLLIALLQGGLALLVGCGLLAAVTFAGYAEAAARTVTFSALILMNLGLILTSRTSTRVGRPSWRGANPSLWAVIGGAVALLAAVLLIAPLRSVFRLAPPSALNIALAIAAGAVAFAGFEVIKALVGHRAARR
jgi:Ca2+-transporting ATPase